MYKRGYWLDLVGDAWLKRNVVWLSGVRRAGKTFLCRSLPDTEFFDCELPRVRAQLGDPEAFLAKVKGKRIVIDEIHRLDDPSELLKIAADYHPGTKIVATGSSSLSASRKFKDTLTGRKLDVWLTPMTLADLADFGSQDIERRLRFGGLPPHFLMGEPPEREIQDWMDAYWAKDIQDLFRLERRHSFLRFAELLMAQSGGIFEANSFSAPCEASRKTISNYLGVLEATYVATVVRPFSRRAATEIIAAPKVYAFDTGFVCCFKSVGGLRPADKGFLWEHLVLNEMLARLQSRRVNYWRDKAGHEVDFILVRSGKPPLAVECKWASREFDPGNLRIFSRRYPEARCVAVCGDVSASFRRNFGALAVEFIGLPEFSARLDPMRSVTDGRPES